MYIYDICIYIHIYSRQNQHTLMFTSAIKISRDQSSKYELVACLVLSLRDGDRQSMYDQEIFENEPVESFADCVSPGHSTSDNGCICIYIHNQICIFMRICKYIYIYIYVFVVVYIYNKQQSMNSIIHGLINSLFS